MSDFIPSRSNPYPDGTYPITGLYLFPEYQTRADFKMATGEDAPPYNPTQPVKNWRDISAIKKRTVLYKFLVSDNVGNLSVGEEETLSGAFAASVNMLPAEKEVMPKESGDKFPTPVRDLFEGEEIVIDFGNIPKLRDKSLAKTPAVAIGGGFTEADRKMLKEIYELVKAPPLPVMQNTSSSFSLPVQK